MRTQHPNLPCGTLAASSHEVPSMAPHLGGLCIVQCSPPQLEVSPFGSLEWTVLFGQHPLFDDGLKAQKRTHEHVCSSLCSSTQTAHWRSGAFASLTADSLTEVFLTLSPDLDLWTGRAHCRGRANTILCGAMACLSDGDFRGQGVPWLCPGEQQKGTG